MPNQTRTSSFPATEQDVSDLKQTATDAVNDLSSTALAHVSKARNQFKDLAAHVREEGGDHLDQVRGKVSDLISVVSDYASDRPLVCIGAALAIGFLIGLSRRRSSRG